MTVGPDITGMRAALNRKREALGESVTFFFPAEKTWPVGTELDPLTNKPYDPQIEPEEVESKDPVTKLCEVAFKPPLKEDTIEASVGDVKVNTIFLWMPLEDWDDLEGAISFNAKGENYLIRKFTDDGIGSDFRKLVWGERQSPAWP